MGATVISQDKTGSICQKSGFWVLYTVHQLYKRGNMTCSSADPLRHGSVVPTHAQPLAEGHKLQRGTAGHKAGSHVGVVSCCGTWQTMLNHPLD